MQEFAEQLLSLTGATRVAPGDVSPNCIWRWCRRGVLSRSGDRIRLQHIRIGGKLYTTARWIEEFGQRLAEADASHFAFDDESSARMAVTIQPRRRGKRTVMQGARHQDHLDQVRRELDADRDAALTEPTISNGSLLGADAPRSTRPRGPLS